MRSSLERSKNNGEENLDSMETRPLKIMDNEDTSILAKTHVINMKHNKIERNQSPLMKSKNLVSNINMSKLSSNQ